MSRENVEVVRNALEHTVEGGLIQRIEAYATPAAARQAAGLSA